MKTFSLIFNLQIFLKTDGTPEGMESLNGIRVITIMWLILGHEYFMKAVITSKSILSPLVWHIPFSFDITYHVTSCCRKCPGHQTQTFQIIGLATHCTILVLCGYFLLLEVYFYAKIMFTLIKFTILIVLHCITLLALIRNLTVKSFL